MEDSMIIWKFLTREYPNNHQVIYLYVCGNTRSPVTAVEQVMKITRKIFGPALNDHYIQTVVKGYLDYKKKQYRNGEIPVKPIY